MENFVGTGERWFGQRGERHSRVARIGPANGAVVRCSSLARRIRLIHRRVSPSCLAP